MTFSFRDLPIKRKLTLFILVTTSLALLLMGSALITYELITFRRTLAANMAVLAQIIGSNSTAAIAFSDRENAQEILGALAAEHQITAAAIYDDRGRLFARFPNDAEVTVFPMQPGADGYSFEAAHLVMFRPITQEGSRLGTIFLRADLNAMYSRISVYAALLLIVGICSFLATLALAATLQRRVSKPILELAEVARAVSERQDYSVRATKHGNDEIGNLTDAFNQMLTRIGEATKDLSVAKDAAEAANNAKDHFLAVLSHELRTPLSPVISTIAMLQNDENSPPHVIRELEVIRRNVDVEARLIDDLLDVTSIIRGKLQLHREVVDVRVLLEHAVQNYCASTAAEKKLRLTMEVTATETHVLGDGSRMTQVLWNVLQNACKFTPEGGTIGIRVFNEPAADDAPGVVVEVSDSGIGISPDMMPRIFEAFEQGERSRSRVFGGLGLGLAISRAIIEMHGGSIAASSEGRHRGARLTVRLSTVKAPDVSKTKQQLPAAPLATESRHLRILLVEDHADTARQLTRLLERAGHQVTCVGSVTEARERGRRGEFDILISDLGLPDGSGYDVMRDLAGGRRRIPGIALSGFGMKEDVDNSLAAGFSRHFTKPVDWQELKSEIQRIAHSDN